jgi:hypothetical protein
VPLVLVGISDPMQMASIVQWGCFTSVGKTIDLQSDVLYLVSNPIYDSELLGTGTSLQLICVQYTKATTAPTCVVSLCKPSSRNTPDKTAALICVLL